MIGKRGQPFDERADLGLSCMLLPTQEVIGTGASHLGLERVGEFITPVEVIDLDRRHDRDAVVFPDGLDGQEGVAELHHLASAHVLGALGP